MSKTPSQKYRLKKLFMGYSRNFYVSSNLFYRATHQEFVTIAVRQKNFKKNPGQRIKFTNEIK